MNSLLCLNFFPSFSYFSFFFSTACGRSIVSFILHSSEDSVTQNRMITFKKSLCENLKLVQGEVTFILSVRFPQPHLVFQLPTEALPVLRHCTGWRKGWLFSLDVAGVQVSGEQVIAVQELKISQLRLQEDPGKIIIITHCKQGDDNKLKL